MESDVLLKSIQELKGIGDKSADLYRRLDISNQMELLKHYPIGYETFKPPVTISQAMDSGLCSIRARLASPLLFKKGRRVSLYTCTITDGTGTLRLVFFNTPYIKSILKPDVFYIFRGVVKEDFSLEQPTVYRIQDYERLTSTLRPRYALTKGLTHNNVTKAVETVLNTSGALDSSFFRDKLPREILERYQLTDRFNAVKNIHFPQDEPTLLKARSRLVFDEFFNFIYMLRSHRCLSDKHKSPFTIKNYPEVETFINRLPYMLTKAQRNAYKDIFNDMSSGYSMNRLIQGDVGSGKTIISVLALLLCVLNGYQGALMAPTEVLAKQHFDNISSFADKFDLPLVPVLLTGGMGAKQRRETLSLISEGGANLIIGTHALIQDKVDYKNLALVVTDEQHRFGVRQREALSGKGKDVHILVMSATPIPRTLALILYGDLSITIVNELPASRLPIKNTLLGPGSRPKAWSFILKEIKKGRQAYIICPMVEEGEMEGLENVLDYTEKLREAMPQEVKIAYLHGRMKGSEKTDIMEAYGRGEIDIIVSTTVIEVGIDVPNSTVMLIENSERFGLSQLHQLRGRIGRGKEQSYCIFLTGTDKDLKNDRLNVMAHTNDGFKIAEEDLKLRGPGDLTGIRQSGSLAFSLGDICRDSDILKQASQAVDLCLNKGIEIDISPDMNKAPVL